MHNNGHQQVGKALASLSQLEQEQPRKNETQTQMDLLRKRLHEVLGLFKPPRPVNATLDGVKLPNGADHYTSTEKGSTEASISRRRQRLIRKCHMGKAFKPVLPSSSQPNSIPLQGSAARCPTLCRE